MYTAFTITVDARDGITTGISAADRATTLLKMSDPSARPEHFRRPGHIFPLRCRPGGVLVRPGHTEASVDLARLAGCFPAGALCEIVSRADGSMARTPELLRFAKQHGIMCITIADLMRYRLKHEQLVELTGSAVLDTPRYGRLHLHTFRSALDGAEHVAVVSGDVAGKSSPVLVHVQRESRVTDLLGCASSSGGSAEGMLQRISAPGQGGVLIYMQHKQAGSEAGGLAEEIRQLQAASATSSSAEASLDLRDYGLAAQMLSALKVQSAVLASTEETQLLALKSCGVRVMGTAPLTAVFGGPPHTVNGHAKVASPLN